MKKHVVLVGGAGLIGHHLTLALRSSGWAVTIIDSLMINNQLVIDDPLYLAMIAERQRLIESSGARLMVLDARDYHMLSRAMAVARPDAVVHLAAVAHIDRSNKTPHTTFDHSLRTLENALDVCREIGCAHFVYFSSSTVYGNFPSPVLTEESDCRPFGIYGAVKLAGEHIVRAYQDVFGINCTIVRPCAVYGPRCVSRRVIQIFIENAIAGKDLTIFGTGEEREDFTFVDDLVQGVMLVLQNPDAASGQTFNLTAGAARSLDELAGIVAAHFPGTVVRHGEADAQKPHRGTMSIDKAGRLLGYRPGHTLESGIREYVTWYARFRGTADGRSAQARQDKGPTGGRPARTAPAAVP